MPEKSGVLFRVASKPSAGGGHVSRCLAVAAALNPRAPVLMVLDPGADAAAARCEAAGIRAVLGGPVIPKEEWGVCLLDGYNFSPDEIARYADIAPLVVMDDFGRPHADAALAINSAIHMSGDRLGGVPALLGPRYALVNSRFAALPRKSTPEQVAEILVTFGLIDPDNATGLALSALNLLRVRGAVPRVTAVVGMKDQAASVSGQIGDEVTILSDVADMAPLLAKADLVIGAGGVSLYERMAAGVPSVSLLIAENQRLFVEGAASEGATWFAGDARALSTEALAECIADICDDQAARQRMSERGRALVDGRGAERVAQALLVLCANQCCGATA